MTVKILIIEDNYAIADILSRRLDRYDVHHIAASDGKTGVRIAGEECPDIIFLDFNLTDIDGEEVMKQLKEDENTASIPVVMMSADYSGQRRERAIAAGCVDYISKPIDKKLFVHTIERELGISLERL
ncbi:MAG: response regulator [Chloroflexota bacterium]